MVNYPEKSAEVQARLMRLGLMPNHLVMIGSFVVAYGLFETTLERALWSLAEVDVSGKRPYTEKMRVEEQFKALGEGSPRLNAKCNAVLKLASEVAVDLNDYRNSLVHGHLIFLGKSPPSFLKNPAWHGELRNKAAGDAYIDEPFQDLMLVAAWTLVQIATYAEKCMSDTQAQAMIESLEEDVRTARSYANETRHLRHLVNSEKY